MENFITYIGFAYYEQNMEYKHWEIIICTRRECQLPKKSILVVETIFIRLERQSNPDVMIFVKGNSFIFFFAGFDFLIIEKYYYLESPKWF